MKNTMRSTAQKLTTPEALTRSYKEMFPGIPDAEAEELAALFLQGIGGRDIKRTINPLRQKLAEIRQKYEEIDPLADIDFSIPDDCYSIEIPDDL